MNKKQITTIAKTLIVALPFIVLYGYLLAIIYQRIWLMQFGIPSDFVVLNSNTLLIAGLSSIILLSILIICFYAFSPLLNKSNIFQKPSDSANYFYAGTLGIAMVLTSIILGIGFFHFNISIEQFSWGFIGGIAGAMILTTACVVQWGLKSRADKSKWYAKRYLYFERRLMTPIIFAALIFLAGSYLVTGQLSIINWQSYIKDPNYVLVDGKEKYILIGVFGDKVGVVKSGELGIEGATKRFVDIERITFQVKI